MAEILVLEWGYTWEPVHEAMVVVPVDPGCGGFLEVAEPVERTLRRRNFRERILGLLLRKGSGVAS